MKKRIRNKNRTVVTINSLALPELRKAFDGGRLATVVFIKKENGKTRVLNGKTKVLRGLVGGTEAYDATSKGQLRVFDVNAKDPKTGKRVGGYRTVTANNVTEIRTGGKIYKAKNVQPETSWLGDSHYDGKTKTFDVRLNGTLYRYFDVSGEEASDYYNATNRVEFFNDNIKKHNYLRLS